MRILQIAPLWETVPPPAYGGTEAVVHALVQELVRRGHDITLVASGDSCSSAELVSFYPRSLRSADHIEDKRPYTWHHAVMALGNARDYDIIHNHAGEEVMALGHLLPDVPMLTTMHCLITADTKIIWDSYRGYYNTISRSQREQMPEIAGGTFVGSVHNAIEVSTFPFDPQKDDYLLFLSRISPDKAPNLAVEVARRTGHKLILAGKVDPADSLFFSTAVAPLIDGEQVVFVGEADARTKRELYRKARCVLMPICWEEPFGLVLVEAMACGTPVIAFNRGAVPEIVRHGETGFLVNTVEQMAEAVHRVGQLDPWRCRQHVATNFDVPIMTEAYLGLYESILAQEFVAPTIREPATEVSTSVSGLSGDGQAESQWSQVA